MKKLLLIVFSLFFTTTAFAYDKDLAKSYEQYFSPFAGKATAKTLQMIPTKKFAESLKKGEKMFLLDIRTPAETGVYGINFPGSKVIPMNDVFRAGNLAKLPTTEKIVIICKGGHRAMAVATGLRHIGFKNVFVLKHGLSDLAKYLSPKNAY